MEQPHSRRVAVTGGGTAGHILPAVEFLRAYRREFGASGYFIGCAAGLETRLVPAACERLEVIPGWPWARQGAAGRLRAIACVPGAVIAARRILRREKTEVVIGVGGYASLSACIAAWSLGIPVVVYDSNASLGLANRMAARFASLICVGMEEAGPRVRGEVEVTGVPAAHAIENGWSNRRPWRFLVLGGSEGSPLLNAKGPQLFAELKQRGLEFSVRHVAGFRDAAPVRQQYAAAGVDAAVDGFVDDLASAYSSVTLAIATAGAHTMAELSAAGIPSVLVPLSGAAADHQWANARMYANRTGAAVVREAEWDTRVEADRVEAILSNGQLQSLHERAASWSNHDAAANLVRACERILTARGKG